MNNNTIAIFLCTLLSFTTAPLYAGQSSDRHNVALDKKTNINNILTLHVDRSDIEFYVLDDISTNDQNSLKSFLNKYVDTSNTNRLYDILNRLPKSTPYAYKIIGSADKKLVRVFIRVGKQYLVSTVNVSYGKLSWYLKYSNYITNLCAGLGLVADKSVVLDELDSTFRSLLSFVRSVIANNIVIERHLTVNENDGTIDVKIVIRDENAPLTLRNINFYGLDRVKESDILRYLNQKGLPRLWNNENRNKLLQYIEQFFIENGYADFTINSIVFVMTPDRKFVDMYCDITEFRQLILKNLVLNHKNPVPNFLTANFYEKALTNDVFVYSNLEKYVKKYICDLEERTGQIVTSHQITVSQDSGGAYVTVVINNENRVLVDSIEVTSNYREKEVEKVVRQALKVDKDSGLLILNKQSIINALENKYRSNIFADRTLRYDYISDDRVIVRVDQNKLSEGKVKLSFSASGIEAGNSQFSISYNDFGKFLPNNASRLAITLSDVYVNIVGTFNRFQGDIRYNFKDNDLLDLRADLLLGDNIFYKSNSRKDEVTLSCIRRSNVVGSIDAEQTTNKTSFVLSYKIEQRCDGALLSINFLPATTFTEVLSDNEEIVDLLDSQYCPILFGVSKTFDAANRSQIKTGFQFCKSIWIGGDKSFDLNATSPITGAIPGRSKPVSSGIVYNYSIVADLFGPVIDAISGNKKPTESTVELWPLKQNTYSATVICQTNFFNLGQTRYDSSLPSFNLCLGVNGCFNELNWIESAEAYMEEIVGTFQQMYIDQYKAGGTAVVYFNVEGVIPITAINSKISFGSSIPIKDDEYEGVGKGKIQYEPYFKWNLSQAF